jgi:predicted AlkP superfamily pyrophosphatase or phosphodiesterase
VKLQHTLQQVDTFAKDLQESLEARNLTSIVDVVFVSDHGMTDTSHPELLYLDDILGDGFPMIEHQDGELFVLNINDRLLSRMVSPKVGHLWVFGSNLERTPRIITMFYLRQQLQVGGNSRCLLTIPCLRDGIFPTTIGLRPYMSSHRRVMR